MKIIPGGISFNLSAQDKQNKKFCSALLNSLKRLHVNCGHPTNSDLNRCLRVAGASKYAQQAVTKMVMLVLTSMLPTLTMLMTINMMMVVVIRDW